MKQKLGGQYTTAQGGQFSGASKLSRGVGRDLLSGFPEIRTQGIVIVEDEILYHSESYKYYGYYSADFAEYYP